MESSNNFEQQVQVLNALMKIMHDSANGPYEEMCCEFEYERYKGGWSVGSKYSLIRDGLFLSELLDDPEENASSYVHELHELMKAHTGGDWKKFILSIDSSRKANTKFMY